MHKLLVFNEDYGDEHDVPALVVMTEKNYQKWLKSPSGILNKNYKKQIKIYEANEKLSADFWGMLKKKGYKTIREIPKDDSETLALKKVYNENYIYMGVPNKVNSKMSAWLGNSGECFEESYEHLYLMEEFVKEGLVKVFDVDESFANIFHKADLASLSLCNIFEIELY